jgi:hypothetical protein
MACPSRELADLIVAQMHERDAFAATLKAARVSTCALTSPAPQSTADLRERLFSVRAGVLVERAIRWFPRLAR